MVIRSLGLVLLKIMKKTMLSICVAESRLLKVKKKKKKTGIRYPTGVLKCTSRCFSCVFITCLRFLFICLFFFFVFFASRY